VGADIIRPFFLIGQGLSLFRLFRQSRKIHLPLWEGNLKINRAAVLNKKPLSPPKVATTVGIRKRKFSVVHFVPL